MDLKTWSLLMLFAGGGIGLLLIKAWKSEPLTMDWVTFIVVLFVIVITILNKVFEINIFEEWKKWRNTGKK